MCDDAHISSLLPTIVVREFSGARDNAVGDRIDVVLRIQQLRVYDGGRGASARRSGGLISSIRELQLKVDDTNPVSIGRNIGETQNLVGVTGFEPATYTSRT